MAVFKDCPDTSLTTQPPRPVLFARILLPIALGPLPDQTYIFFLFQPAKPVEFFKTQNVDTCLNYLGFAAEI